MVSVDYENDADCLKIIDVDVINENETLKK